MSIATAIQNAQQRVANAYTAISNKGGTLPATQNLSNMPTAIDSIPSGSAPRFGTTIAAYIGVVDTYDGQLKTPEEQTNGITFTGVQDVEAYALCYKFIYRYSKMTGVVSFPDLKNVSGNYALTDFCRETNISGVSFPELETVSGISSFSGAFNSCDLISSGVSFPKLTTISGSYAFYQIFSSCGITSASFSLLETLSGSYCLGGAFGSCSNLSTVSFDSLNTITGSRAFSNCFTTCYSLSSMYFPSLKTSSFGSNVNQFQAMFNSNTAFTSGGCTIHFPSNLQSTISGLTGYPTFGGNASRIVLSFDLPATS